MTACKWLRRLALTAIASNFAVAALAQYPGGEQKLVLGHIRVTAGEARTVTLPAKQTVEAIVSIRSIPTLRSPILARRSEGALSVTVPPATPRGDYQVEVMSRDAAGASMKMRLEVTVDALTIPKSQASQTPVILVNGLQLACTDTASTLAASEGTFGSLDQQLTEQNVPVLFFNNCPYGDVPIETLGAELGAYISGLTYDDGTPVEQVDLVTHSMGGLIVRAYLAGLQVGGTLSPPSDPKVRKFVEIATPNFGSFVAGNLSWLTGTQSSEMIPGSQFLWSLATWNEFGDDLRGVDALAIVGIGNAGSGSCCSILDPTWTSDASDGVVSVTSASLGFASQSYAQNPSRTREVPYCHTDAILLPNCSGPPIANVDKAPETGEIVLSFLQGTSGWQSFGDPNQTLYGGVYFALVNAQDTQYEALQQVSLGTQAFQSGASNAFFYDEFVTGTDTFDFTTSGGQSGSCGTFTVPGGYYTAYRCKYGPRISFVGPLLQGVSGNVVQSGSSITIYGSAFGSQQCSGCQVWAYPGQLPLQISTWTDASITAFLPTSFSGFTQLSVQAATGLDTANIMAQPAPLISLSPSQVLFSYAIGNAVPSPQNVSILNSGGGTLTWSASPNVPWLSVSSTVDGLTISLNPGGLSPGQYNGVVTVTATGATNSPQNVSVTLTVTAQTPPSLSLSTNQASFTYTVGGAALSPLTVLVSNSGSGTLSWSAKSSSSWIDVSLAANSFSLSVNPAGLSPGSYSGTVTVAAMGASNSPQQVAVTLTVSAGSSTPPTSISAVVNAASYRAGVSAGMLASIFGQNLSTVVGIQSPGGATSYEGVSVTVDGILAPLFTVANVNGQEQINFQVPTELASSGTVTVQVNNKGSMGSISVPTAPVQPGIFEYSPTGSSGSYAVVVKPDGSVMGPSNPAARGTTVVMYMTGLGPTTPTLATGQPGPIPPATTNYQPVVGLNDGGVPVLFSGIAPGFMGLYQVNFTIPANAPVGTTVKLSVGIDGAFSQNSTIAIQ